MQNWHLLQTDVNTCVPTCFAMVAARCRVPFAPAGLEPLSAKGFDLTSFPLPSELTAQRLTLGLEDLGLAQVRAALAQPGWVLASVCGPVWVGVTGERAHPTFGRLCHLGGWGAPFHAVVICTETPAGFLVLDPWLATANQPLIVSADELMSCVAGQAVAIKLPD